MRKLKTKRFTRFARQERISDESLTEAVSRAERGLIDADLGGGLVKQRVARPGRGRSGGFRTVIAYRVEERAIFLFGFAKSDRDNIEDDELAALREVAATWLQATDAALDHFIAQGFAEEIEDDQDNQNP